jgi:GNAT superfamily N-acetyltransferase
MILIRPAVAADCEQVFTLTVKFATSFQLVANTFRASFARLLEQSGALLLVAEESGAILGYLLAFDHDTLFANGRVAWIEEVMVCEDRRRRGIGRELMACFEQWAKSRGSVLAALATRRATAFYLALGYEQSAAYYRKLL